MSKRYEHHFQLRVKKVDRYYYDVYVFKTEKVMHKTFKTREKTPNISRFYAAVQPYDSYKLGALYLYLPKTGAGIIAHEALHMALWYDKQVFKNTDLQFDMHSREERLASTLETIVRLLIKKLNRLKSQ